MTANRSWRTCHFKQMQSNPIPTEDHAIQLELYTDWQVGVCHAHHRHRCVCPWRQRKFSHEEKITWEASSKSNKALIMCHSQHKDSSYKPNNFLGHSSPVLLFDAEGIPAFNVPLGFFFVEYLWSHHCFICNEICLDDIIDWISQNMSILFKWHRKKRLSASAWVQCHLNELTHWGWVTNLTIIGSDNGLLPGRRQAIIWTNAGILFIGPLRSNFSEILFEILTFSIKEMRLKVSSWKWRPFCLCLSQTGHVLL